MMRAYTPTSSDDDLGHFDLVVKVYFGNQHKDFPEVGPPQSGLTLICAPGTALQSKPCLPGD